VPNDASTTLHSQNVPGEKFGVLPDGVVRWCANLTLADDRVVNATFDIPRSMASGVAHLLDIKPGRLAPAKQVKRCVLKRRAFLSLVCTLGEIEHSARDSFVPLNVVRVTLAGGAKA